MDKNDLRHRCRRWRGRGPAATCRDDPAGAGIAPAVAVWCRLSRDDQVRAHETAVRLFQHEAESGQNARVKSVAEHAAWVLQRHPAVAKQQEQALPSMTARK